MKIPMNIYENDQIMLCPFDRELIINYNSDYKNWFLNQEVTKYNSHGLFVTSEKEFCDYLKSIEEKKILCCGIIYKKDKKHIGNVSLQNFNYINRSCEMAILIGEADYHGKGIATQSIKFLFNHAFNKLNMHRIYSGTAATNLGMLKCFQKLGMTKECEFRDATYLNGKYENIHCYGILKQEWINFIKDK